MHELGLTRVVDTVVIVGNPNISILCMRQSMVFLAPISSVTSRISATKVLVKKV